MVKLLSTISLILALVLFPPAALALISNNAVPGDATYPIKRTLEDGIYAIASLNPITRAWFSATRSDRRFKEFSTLIAQGKSASDTLDELVAQTQVAAEELKKVDDPIRKQELISQLSQSIDKYSQKLEAVSIGSQPPPSQPSVVATPIPTTTPIPPRISPPSGVTSPRPTATFRSTSTPQPSETLRPVPPSTNQTPFSPQSPVDQKDLDDAKEKLEDIKDKLDKEEKKSHQEKGEDKRENRKDDKKERDKEKRNKDSDHDKKRD